MSSARIAVHLDPARELEDFQTAATALVTYGLVTDIYPHAGALALVRRFEEPLRNEFNRLCHWRLDVAPSCARLLRRPAALSSQRMARSATQSKREFSPQTYMYLCLALAAFEGLGQQTTISQLASEVSRLRAGDEALPFDLTAHAHRRAFVDAVAWLQHRGVVVLLDGDTETFVGGGGDALYDIDRDAASRLLMSPPSVLAGLTEPDEFLDEPYPPTVEGEQAQARHRVHRRLLTETSIAYDELPPVERDYARQRRTRIKDEMERLTGGTLECRAEGQALIGVPAAEAFPAGGAIAQAALLLGSELAVAAAEAEPTAGSVARVVPLPECDAAWRRVVAAYGGRFTSDYKVDPARLRTEAMELLERLDLASPCPAGGVQVRPALARYRARVRLPEALDA